MSLYCVYHPIDEMRVVNAEERESLKATGVWFDSPKEAEVYRDHVEENIQNERREADEAKSTDEDRNDADNAKSKKRKSAKKQDTEVEIEL